MKLCCLGLLLVLTVGCASTGAKFSETVIPEQVVVPEGKALVYMYCPGGLIGAAKACKIAADGVLLAKMSPGAYYSFPAEAGKAIHFTSEADKNILNLGLITAFMDWEKDALHATFQEGTVYYLCFNIVEETFTVVDKEEALPQIAKCGIAKPLANKPAKKK